MGNSRRPLRKVKEKNRRKYFLKPAKIVYSPPLSRLRRDVSPYEGENLCQTKHPPLIGEDYRWGECSQSTMILVTNQNLLTIDVSPRGQGILLIPKSKMIFAHIPYRASRIGRCPGDLNFKHPTSNNSASQSKIQILKSKMPFARISYPISRITP